MIDGVLLLGFFTPWIIFGGILTLHLVLPARRVLGYVRDQDSGALLSYRLNGPLSLVVCVAIWVALGLSDAVPWDWLWQHRWPGLAGACTLGVVVSAAVVLSTPSRGGSWLVELYIGRRENPQMFKRRADAKMVLYLAGAIVLQLNLLSFAAHHFLTYPDDPSPGVVLYLALFSWFLCDYLVFERVHLYTYDLFAERLGFKLVWGCLAWYPYFYAVGLWSAADLPNPHAPSGLLVVAALVFFAGWVLARGANLQKFTFKQDPERAFLGRMKPKAFSDGERQLLRSGFWGIARHCQARQLLGRSPDGLRLGAGARLAAAGRPVALSALLFGAVASQGARRRPPLRRKVRRTLAAVPERGALAHRAEGLLNGRRG